MKRKALFVYGGWEGHEPAKCRDLFVPWMQKAGFDVTVSDPQARVRAAMLIAAIGGAVIHPLVLELDDESLRLQLLKQVRKLLPVRA